MVNLV